jgi:uncharacterized DUF497 family protein
VQLLGDEGKRHANLLKHGVDFRDAADLFQGPMLVKADDRDDYGEDRSVGFGFIQGRLMAIVFTEPDSHTVRVISLRKATKHEQALFEKEIRHRLGQG